MTIPEPSDELVLKVAKEIEDASATEVPYWNGILLNKLARAVLAIPELSALQEKVRRLEEALRAMMRGSELLAKHYKIDLCNDVESGSAYQLARTALTDGER